MVHQLKLVGEGLADAVSCGDKPYEIRIHDRNYNVGDMLYQVLYDKSEQRYKKNYLNVHMYIISYVSEIMCMGDEPYVVLGIHKVLPSKTAVKGILDMFRYSGEMCKLITYDKTYDNCLILNRRVDSLTINAGGNIIDTTADEVVWAVPIGKEEEGRSVNYCDIGFDSTVDYTDFSSYHMYELFEKRILIEKASR